MAKRWVMAICLTAVAACGQLDVSSYSERQPVLKLEQFFNGELTAHGVVKDRSGLVIRTFNADIKAYWLDGVGTLEEDFIFDDGEAQRRVWTLTPTDDGRYVGTAGDVSGEAELRVAGNALFLEYVLQIPYRGSNLDVVVDDRMYLVSPQVLINESTLRKFGVRVGELTLVILRSEAV